jgi:hypothetical protein
MPEGRGRRKEEAQKGRGAEFKQTTSGVRLNITV